MKILSYLRPRYSLRALLVVMTALGLFFGYHINWIQQRHALIRSDAISVDAGYDYLGPPSAPGLLWMFGEEGYRSVAIEVKDSQWKAEQVQALFPESIVIESIPFPESP